MSLPPHILGSVDLVSLHSDLLKSPMAILYAASRLTAKQFPTWTSSRTPTMTRTLISRLDHGKSLHDAEIFDEETKAPPTQLRVGNRPSPTANHGWRIVPTHRSSKTFLIRGSIQRHCLALHLHWSDTKTLVKWHKLHERCQKQARTMVEVLFRTIVALR